jgi:DNA-binding transcriptional regulator YhcF (GntR family)
VSPHATGSNQGDGQPRTTPPLSIDDVHQALLERISAMSFPVGSRLPSCRALAAELGSNPSTVDRAVQRLAQAGLVRTIPRRGTFVSASEPPREDLVGSMGRDLDRLLARALASGLSAAEIRTRVDEALARADRQPRVAFVECNPIDLDRMATLVENATGVTVERIQLDQIEGTRLDTKFDIVAAPLFHLADLVGHVASLDSVVEINFVAAAPVLRQLATLRGDQHVVVAAPTRRGLDRMTALVRQYYPNEVTPFLIGVDPVSTLAGVDAVVRSNAADLPPGALDHVGSEIVVEWELDPWFVPAFRARAAQALSRRQVV